MMINKAMKYRTCCLRRTPTLEEELEGFWIETISKLKNRNSKLITYVSKLYFS